MYKEELTMFDATEFKKSYYLNVRTHLNQFTIGKKRSAIIRG